MNIRSGLWLPPFDELADPAVLVELAAEAEDAGWDGVFLWDHIRWRPPVRAVADPWISLAAIATATERVRFGPMVTAVPRRRPAKLARETATLDRLGRGRLILGVGLGSNRFGEELIRFGEQLDDRTRAAMLDDCLAILRDAWSGEPVRHHGEHYTVDDVTFLPRPVAGPALPVWVAGYPGKVGPQRRAAGQDGYFPVNLGSPDELAEGVAAVEGFRTDRARPYDYVVALSRGTDPRPYAAAGATWWLTDWDPETVTVDQVRAVLRDGVQLPG